LNEPDGGLLVAPYTEIRLTSGTCHQSTFASLFRPSTACCGEACHQASRSGFVLARFCCSFEGSPAQGDVDETYIRVRGQWRYLYRAIDSNGDTVEFWFGERRNLAAAKRFLRKALKRHGRPERIVIDGSQTNREAIRSCDTADRLQDRSRHQLKPIRIRRSAYLNNRIEQDHRAIKRRVRPMLGLKTMNSARVILGGIETVHMMRKQQAIYAGNPQPSLAEQFHLLAG
jgi:transposase-like protein